MSGLSDVMAVFGFIDQAVVSDPGLRPKVSALLPGYDKGAAGWYQRVSEWIPAAVGQVESSGEVEASDGSEDPRGPEGVVGDSGIGRGLDDPAPTFTTTAMKNALVAFAGLSGVELMEDDLVPRRLLALAVLGRIWPSPAQAHSPLAYQLAAADLGADDLVRALQPLTADRNKVTAGQLLSLFAGDQDHPGQAWQSLLAEAAGKDWSAL